MKPALIIALIVLALTAVIAAALYLVRLLKIALFKKNIPELPAKFTVTARTGCRGSALNTLDSIKKGIESGADVIEFDLRFDENGEPVLSHGVPSKDAVHLKDALTLISEHKNIKANIDVKETSNLALVSRYAEECGVLRQVFFTGISAKDVSAAERIYPAIPFYINYTVNTNGSNDMAYISHVIEIVENCGAIGINMNYSGASGELVESFHNEGLLVSLRTVNSKIKLCKALRFSPDNITTKHPERLLALLGKSAY